ncbi:MAG: hypothetical protein JSU81_09800 [Candidatus Coatesbacteria bacterium]|nr:MAG: hypothetical protein JSU81_09800 [Candidatus Coatesbacteria bacterium]
MRAAALALILLPTATPASETPTTYADVAALVARAEAGDVSAGEAYDLLETAPDVPLAGAGLGRLRLLRARDAPFAMFYYVNLYLGFQALNDYIADHHDDPLPHLWRAASAVETRYVMWGLAEARADLELTCRLCGEDPYLPNHEPRARLLLGIMAKDEGDLEGALRLWSQAYAGDPTGPVGREAAKLLDLFTG